MRLARLAGAGGGTAAVALALLGATPLAASAPPPAVVTLTAAGPQPSQVTVDWGGAVSFVNSDTVPHDIVSSGPEIGSRTVAPGASVSVVFAGQAGTHAYVETAQPRSFYGSSIVVALNDTLSLVANATPLRYGLGARLVGRTSLPPGSPIIVLQRPLNIYGNGEGDFLQFGGTRTTAADGSFSVPVRPLRGTEYEATAAAGQLVSATAKIPVLPSIVLSVPGSARTSPAKSPPVASVRVAITVAPAAAASNVDLEGYSAKFGRWLRIGSLHLVRGRVVTTWPAPIGVSHLRAEITAGEVRAGLVGTISAPRTIVVR